MKPMSKKTSAAILVGAVDALKIIGIDATKCAMPYVDNETDAHGRRSMSYDPTSAGFFISNRLQPALERLATAVVLEHAAPFFDSQLRAAKSEVAESILLLAAQSGHCADKAGLSTLVQTIQAAGFDGQLACVQSLTDDISRQLTNKVRIAATELTSRGK